MPDGLQLKYFVLRPKGTDLHAKASRAAMRHYAKMVSEHNPQLANDLRNWTDQEQIALLDQEQNDQS